MSRLDNERVAAWRAWRRVANDVDRAIDTDLRHEWAISLGLFEVLTALRDADGRARPLELADAMGIPASSLSRRLDRLAEEGWILRHGDRDGDGRAVEVELTPPGRKLWREMNISYRRSLQREFARHLDDDQIAAIVSLVATIRG